MSYEALFILALGYVGHEFDPFIEADLCEILVKAEDIHMFSEIVKQIRSDMQ